jgi:chromosome segregation protein
MDTVKEAEGTIEFLGEHQLGRATILAMDRLAEKSFAELPQELLEEPGVLCRGTDCVSIEPVLMPLVHHLLDYVIMVKDRSAADALARKWSSRRLWFVTPDGESHATNGFITGGRTGKTEIGLISRKQTIEKLKQEIIYLDERLSKKIAEKEATIATRKEARIALLEADERLNVGRRAQHEQTSNLKHLDERTISINDRINKLNEEAVIVRDKINDLSDQENQLSQEREALQQQKVEIEGATSRFTSDMEEKDRIRTSMQAEYHHKQLEVTGLRNKVEQQVKDAARLTEVIEQTERKKLQKQHELDDCSDQIRELQEKLQVEGEQLERMLQERAALECVRDEARESYNTIIHEIDEKRKKEKTLSAELERIQGEYHQAEMDQTRTEDTLRHIRERVWEAYEIDLNSTDIPDAQAAWDPDTVTEEIAMYKERIKRVGQVNMAALEDYEVENLRFEELSAQRNDLSEAKESLEKAIKKLDRSAREQFLNTFNTVQKNFSEVFISLFEGGEAHLSLQEGVDPLEAAIEINARPTGKKMRGVQLLSGGERALTAISLLFALYLTKPSPYCILDEVDAPLDDANIGRFANLIRKFSEKTQFIVITHNKVTMEAADMLYGVTMQERGVSKVVSVRFKELEAMAA